VKVIDPAGQEQDVAHRLHLLVDEPRAPVGVELEVQVPATDVVVARQAVGLALEIPGLGMPLELKPEHVQVVRHAMVGVSVEGTSAASFRGAGYVAGGKTGTAQVIAMGQKYEEHKIAERHRDHSLFIAFAPADSPRIALAVIIENGGFGARAAAPVARTVLDYFMLGKVPAGMDQPTPEDDSVNEEEEGD